MTETLSFQLLIVTLLGLTVGSVFLVYNFVNKKAGGKSNLGFVISGWALVSIAIIAGVLDLIFYINDNGGLGGLYLFVFISPIFILGGFIFLLSYGISSLVRGCQKDANGLRNKDAIVRGAFLTFLAIAVIVSIVVSVGVLMHNYSSANGDKPVMGMG